MGETDLLLFFHYGYILTFSKLMIFERKIWRVLLWIQTLEDYTT